MYKIFPVSAVYIMTYGRKILKLCGNNEWNLKPGVIAWVTHGQVFNIMGVNSIGELALGHLLDSPYLDKLGQKSSNELTYKGEFHQHILLVYEKGCETFVNQKEPHYSSRDFEL